MSRIAFAWELGGQLGHATACNALAQSLRLRGHRVAFMFSDLRPLQFLHNSAADEVFEAPAGMGAAHSDTPASYAEILVGCGYASAAGLRPLAHAWRQLLEAWKPDVLIADYAPTALLAARALGQRRIAFGNGFAIPPRLRPMPAFRFDEPVDEARLARFEAQALASANEVLASWGADRLESLAQLLECDEEFLCTFPELDHYGNRPASGYWGPRVQVSAGARVAWPAGGGKRIIVYLKAGCAQIDAVIDLLAASPWNVAAFIPGLDPARRARLTGTRRQACMEPMRLEPLLEQCDLVFSHGGDLAAGLLARGIPQVTFPMQYEQYVTARRIEQMGCGLWIGTSHDAHQVAATVSAVLRDARFAAAARAFARRYAGFSPQEQRRRMAARVEEIAARPATAAPILPVTCARETQQ